MSKKTLVMYEVSQKQKYIFRTNRLIENIGASSIIRRLTEEPQDFFLDLENYFCNEFDRDPIILPKEDTSIVGGGNATLIFSSKEHAYKFANEFTAAVLRHFPGIELFLVTREIDWENESLYSNKNIDETYKKGLLEEMRDALADKKNRREHSVQQLSWGIHQVCSGSGLPANKLWLDKDTNTWKGRASELIVKEKIGAAARNEEFKERLLRNNEFLADKDKSIFFHDKHIKDIFEKKESETKNYLAIVHIDGNSMGNKVGGFLNQKFASNLDYIEKYRKFTDTIDNAYTSAFRKTIAHVMKDYDLWSEQIYGNKAKDEHYKHVVPIRPVVASGDDICFITFGQLGIETARVFIQYLQQQSMNIDGKSHYFEACAGVAIIRRKFPFWIGYELSEKLCTNAKKRLRRDADSWMKYGLGSKDEPFDTSLIDWQLVEGGDFSLDLGDVRSRSYSNKDGSTLIMRPFYLQRENDKYTHFANYKRTFINSMNQIRLSRKRENSGKLNDIPSMSKWKELRDVYHRGKTAVEQWKRLNQFNIDNQSLFLAYTNSFALLEKTPAEHQSSNSEKHTISYYYDALEITDYFIRLSEVKNDAAAFSLN